MTDHFWEIGVNVIGKTHTGYIVYYRTSEGLDPDEVADAAVRDKQLIDVFRDAVEYCLEITAEEYFEHMDS